MNFMASTYLRVEEVDGNTEQRDASKDAKQLCTVSMAGRVSRPVPDGTYNHERGEVVVLVDHRHNTLRRAERDEVLATNDHDHGRARILRDDLGSERRRRDDDAGEGELIDCPA